MPIVWRHLLSHYFKIFLTVLSVFVLLLLAIQLDEIAQFIVFSRDGWKIGRFFLQLIPYIIPIALPISSLLASYLLAHKLSEERTLVALRACGYSFVTLYLPLVCVAALLACANFWIVSEWTTEASLIKRSLQKEIRTLHPLHLLDNEKLSRTKGFYFTSLAPVAEEGPIREAIIAFKTNSGGKKRLALMTARELSLDTGAPKAQQATLIFPAPSNLDVDLIVDNSEQLALDALPLDRLVSQNQSALSAQYLSFPLLLGRRADLLSECAAAEMRDEPAQFKRIEKQLYNCQLEGLRRLAIGALVIPFTLCGLAYGTTQSRVSSARRLVTLSFEVALALAALFGAKNFYALPWLAALLYTLPIVLLTFLSLRRLYLSSRGRWQ